MHKNSKPKAMFNPLFFHEQQQHQLIQILKITVIKSKLAQINTYLNWKEFTNKLKKWNDENN